MQLAPQAPQWAALLWRATQAPPHSVNPELHVKPQAPLTQADVALATDVVHALPQRPQCCRFVWSEAVDRSHPLAALPSQSKKPISHAMRQVPETHDGVPLTALHAPPQRPQ